jgi:uncharacterized membrane protein YeaQ/YmgE (transglycosylase-associated protein family)
MDLIVWTVAAIIVGVVAERPIDGRTSLDVVISCLIGVSRALRGGRIVPRLFRNHMVQGRSQLSDRIRAPAGTAPLFRATRLVEARRSGRSVSGGSRRDRVRRRPTNPRSRAGHPMKEMTCGRLTPIVEA